MPPEIDWVGDEAGLAALGEEWESLLSPEASPFDAHCWFQAWWGAFGADGEPAVCTLRNEGRLDGVFPLRRDGRRLLAMANVHSPSFRPLARDGEAMRRLCRAVLGEGAEVELCGLPEASSELEEIREAARAASLKSLLELSYSSPTVDTGGDFDEWRAQSKKRWGAPLERFRRKMSRDHEAELRIVEAPADLEAEMAEGFRVEASGWKGREGTAILSRPETEAFYAAVARAFAGRDQLRFSRIVLDGEAASFDFTLLCGGRLYLLKTGFDERFRKLAPGLVMRLSIVERCFDLGLRSHELLGGESEWKRKFATGTRPHLTLRAYPRRPVGLSRYWYRSALRPRLRGAYRGLRPARRR